MIVRNPPRRLGDQHTDGERVVPNAVEAAYRTAISDIERCKKNLWSYLAMVLDSTRLMLINLDCVENKGLGDGHRVGGLLQKKIRSYATVTVLMRQLARLKLKDDEELHK